jgi:glycosyltransferase involved in cell wall biosynthesis
MAEAPLRVLALTGHPVEAAGARHRVIQYLPGLRARGFRVDHHAFFDREAFAILYAPKHRLDKARALVEGTLKRAAWLSRGRSYDVILIHHWLHPFTFPPFDVALRRLGTPVVYDLDDAYYAPVGSLGDRLRDKGWTLRTMRTAHTVIAGSEHIRQFVRQHNPSVEVLPTAIDTDRFTPRDFERDRNPLPVIGWVGSHSTAEHLELVYPAILRLAKTHEFVFRVIGAGLEVPLPGVRAEWLPWKLEREVDNFRDLDIGLYPLKDSELARGKHGFKMFQYMTVGVPAVVSDFGANSGIVRHGENAFLASSSEAWHAALVQLLDDDALRRRVGGAGRSYVETECSVRSCSERLVTILRRAAGRAP